MKRIKMIKPLFNALVTTMDAYEEDVKLPSGLTDTQRLKGTLKEYQTVVAVGSMVKDIKVGDKVAINPKRYAVMKHKEDSLKNDITDTNMVIGFNFNTIKLGGVEHLLLYDSDISYIITEEEDDPGIISPSKPNIII